MVWPIETPPAHSTGLESKIISGGGDNFSLDFPFYRTANLTHPGCRRSLPPARQIIRTTNLVRQ